jgi:hypothetical protein
VKINQLRHSTEELFPIPGSRYEISDALPSIQEAAADAVALS